MLAGHNSRVATGAPALSYAVIFSCTPIGSEHWFVSTPTPFMITHGERRHSSTNFAFIDFTLMSETAHSACAGDTSSREKNSNAVAEIKLPILVTLSCQRVQSSLIAQPNAAVRRGGACERPYLAEVDCGRIVPLLARRVGLHVTFWSCD